MKRATRSAPTCSSTSRDYSNRSRPSIVDIVTRGSFFEARIVKIVFLWESKVVCQEVKSFLACGGWMECLRGWRWVNKSEKERQRGNSFLSIFTFGVSTSTSLPGPFSEINNALFVVSFHLPGGRWEGEKIQTLTIRRDFLIGYYRIPFLHGHFICKNITREKKRITKPRKKPCRRIW